MEDNRTKIIEQLLKNAAFEGWNNKTLEKSAESTGYNSKYAYIAFPGGIVDATDYLADRFDKEMLAELAEIDLNKMRIRDRIKTAIIIRLDIYENYKESIRKLAAYYSLPQNMGRGVRNLGQTVSKIWDEAGDNSTDYNWYTKRFLLAGVYSSTLLYWLNDSSENMSATKEFLERRIDNVMSIQKFKPKAKSFIPTC